MRRSLHRSRTVKAPLSATLIAGRSCILVSPHRNTNSSYLVVQHPTVVKPTKNLTPSPNTGSSDTNFIPNQNLLSGRNGTWPENITFRPTSLLVSHIHTARDRGGLRMRHISRKTEGLLLSLIRRSGKTTIVLSRQQKQLITLTTATLSQFSPATLTGYLPRSPISSLHSRVLPTANTAPTAGKMTMSTSTNPSKGHESARDDKDIHFGPFKVTNQVFLRTPHSFALVNLKPLLPGHVLVCPLVSHKRLTDLSPAEITDLFSTVQVVQRMLGRYYFHPNPQSKELEEEDMGDRKLLETGGSFNIAIQDGPEAGQTVGHVHVHVIPRIRDVSAKDVETPSDELYEWMAEEKGNVGGALWDRDHGHGYGNGDRQHHHLQHSSTFGQQRESALGRQPIKGSGSDIQKKEVEALLREEEKGVAGLQARPKPGGSFPSIEDAARTARGMEEMEREAAEYKRVLKEMGILSV